MMRSRYPPLYSVGERTLERCRSFTWQVAGTGQSGGCHRGSLYLTVPLAVLPFSWGITTNLFEVISLRSVRSRLRWGRGATLVRTGPPSGCWC